MNKNTKRFLMLIGLIGVIAVATSAGSGTFAGFNAEVANTGNYFETGTLFLHDNGGTNTCTSESDANNTNTTGTGCDILFAVPSIVAGNTYTAHLTLTNAGSLNAQDIKFDVPTACADAKPSFGTVGTALTATTTYTSITIANLTQTLTDGTQILLSESGHTQTWTVSGGPYAPGASVAVTVASQAANFSYTTAATVAYAAFGTALCGQLQLTIQETTDNTFGTNVASTCAYPASAVATCSFPSTALSSVPASLTALTLGSGTGGNTTTQLTAGKSRYFVVSIQAPASLANNAQNDKASFSLLWHIDQA